MFKKNQKKRILNCFFCQSGQMLDYKKTEALSRFVSDRGKIISRTKTGVCAKHQRQLAREVKRARYLGLMPFVAKI